MAVNNQHKRGYDHGYKDGSSGKRKKWRYPSGSSAYAVKTYKNGYSDGFKQGSIWKKQNDNKSKQGSANAERLRAIKAQGFVRLLAVIALLIAIFGATAVYFNWL